VLLRRFFAGSLLGLLLVGAFAVAVAERLSARADQSSSRGYDTANLDKNLQAM
jgi:hypothetical protein